VHVDGRGLRRFRESGAAKARFPAGADEAILINTGGGLAGGDRFEVDIRVDGRAGLTVSTQAAERVYRTLGPAAKVTTSLEVSNGASLTWAPQETILFDGSALERRLHARLHGTARFFAVEATILGRPASGEVVRHVNFRDRWRIWRDGALLHADDVALDGPPPVSPATLAGAGAMATVLLVGNDTEALCGGALAFLGPHCGVSAWNGKLVARCLARDGFELRKTLIPLLQFLGQGDTLPKVWSF
jgi:urease accessory protein